MGTITIGSFLADKEKCILCGGLYFFRVTSILSRFSHRRFTMVSKSARSRFHADTSNCYGYLQLAHHRGKMKVKDLDLFRGIVSFK